MEIKSLLPGGVALVGTGAPPRTFAPLRKVPAESSFTAPAFFELAEEPKDAEGPAVPPAQRARGGLFVWTVMRAQRSLY